MIEFLIFTSEWISSLFYLQLNLTIRNIGESLFLHWLMLIVTLLKDPPERVSSRSDAKVMCRLKAVSDNTLWPVRMVSVIRNQLALVQLQLQMYSSATPANRHEYAIRCIAIMSGYFRGSRFSNSAERVIIIAGVVIRWSLYR